jgi:hypothetical protein
MGPMFQSSHSGLLPAALVHVPQPQLRDHDIMFEEDKVFRTSAKHFSKARTQKQRPMASEFGAMARR